MKMKATGTYYFGSGSRAPKDKFQELSASLEISHAFSLTSKRISHFDLLAETKTRFY
jgi:hypothetical protein